MSWRDRDWARFTHEERRRLYGGGSSISPAGWVALAAAAIAIGAFAFVERPRLPGHAPVRPAPAPVVYGDGVEVTGPAGRATCTSESANTRLGVWVCTAWTVLQPGQDAAAATNPGGRCGVRHVDQTSRAWVCDSVTPPDPGTLPGGRSPPSRMA